MKLLGGRFWGVWSKRRVASMNESEIHGWALDLANVLATWFVYWGGMFVRIKKWRLWGTLYLWTWRVLRMYHWVIKWVIDVYESGADWVGASTWMSHVTYLREFCHTHERVTSHVWMSHVTRMNESCHTYEWVTSHAWMSHVTQMSASCHTYENVMPHMCIRHVIHMNAPQ